MKNRALFAFAMIVVAALTGGIVACTVVKSTSGRQSGDSSHAGGHYASYSADKYPDLTYAAENAVKAVVSVIKTEEIRQQGYGWWNPDEVRYREQTSGGSGVIISPDGYVATNHHVVENATRLTVKLPGGRTYDAELVGTDADTEVALLKIEATDLPSVPFGNSDSLRLGEWVLAIGNPYDLHSTVTAGIVSAKGRSLGAIQTSGNAGIEAFIQTDAAVNPGNSGGALVNTRGELVGINTLILSRTGGYVGYSFAIPQTIVSKVIADLREHGVVQRAMLGITYHTIDDGVQIDDVSEGGAAQAAGIEPGDIITEIDGTHIAGTADVASILGLKRPGDIIKISAKRDGEVKQFDVVLRNRAGKSELLSKDSFDAIASLDGVFANIELSEDQKRELGIRSGVVVTSVGRGGILARAGIRRGFIITQINGRAVGSVSDLHRITEQIRSIDGITPDGRQRGYEMVTVE